MFKVSRYVVTVPVHHHGERCLAVYQTMTRGLILVPEAAWHRFADHSQHEPSALDALTRQGFLVGERVDEAHVFQRWRQQFVNDPSVIKSKIIVTRACNNACRYCIVEAEPGRMSRQTAQALDRFMIGLIRERKPRQVEDNYTGGEPLLNPRVILESASRRFFFCLGQGIDYSFSIVTNGTLLTPSIVSRLKEVGLSGLRVSIAGPEAIHDSLRPSRTNGKTYRRILENLEAVSGKIPITIETQYDSGSEDYLRLPEMMDDFQAAGIKVDTICFTPIIPRRNESRFKSGTGNPQIWLSLMREAHGRGYRQFAEPPVNACMADFTSRMVFDTDGTLIPCVSLQGGEMAYGNVWKGIDFVAHSQLLRRDFPSECLNECEILPVCMGGCRFNRLARNEDFNGVDCQKPVLRMSLDEYVREAVASNGHSMEGKPV